MAALLRERPAKPTDKRSFRRPAGAKTERIRFRDRRNVALFWLMVPGLAYFLLFHYGALVGNVIAFKEYIPFEGLWGSPWTGVGNFQRMLEDKAFWDAVFNTVWIALLQLVFYFPVPLALALLLHSLTWSSVRRFVQSVAYLPHFISWVIVVALFQQVLGDTGMLNSYLGAAGLHSADIIGNPDAFKPLVVAQVIWKDVELGHDHLPRRALPGRRAAVRGRRDRRGGPLAPLLARHPARHPPGRHPAADHAARRHTLGGLRADAAAT